MESFDNIPIPWCLDFLYEDKNDKIIVNATKVDFFSYFFFIEIV